MMSQCNTKAHCQHRGYSIDKMGRIVNRKLANVCISHHTVVMTRTNLSSTSPNLTYSVLACSAAWHVHDAPVPPPSFPVPPACVAYHLCQYHRPLTVTVTSTVFAVYWMLTADPNSNKHAAMSTVSSSFRIITSLVPPFNSVVSSRILEDQITSPCP